MKNKRRKSMSKSTIRVSKSHDQGSRLNWLRHVLIIAGINYLVLNIAVGFAQIYTGEPLDKLLSDIRRYTINLYDDGSCELSDATVGQETNVTE